MSRSAPPIAVRNQLLTSLPPEVLRSLLPRLRRVSLAVRDFIIAPGKMIEAVFFVESGWISLVATLEDGAQAEVGLVGHEGMVGLPLIVGVDTGFEEAFVQARGAALRMEADAFRRAFEEFPILQARCIDTAKPCARKPFKPQPATAVMPSNSASLDGF